MKVFVYSKKDSHKIAIHENVKCVYESDNIIIIDTEDDSFNYNRNDCKTTIYQN